MEARGSGNDGGGGNPPVNNRRQLSNQYSIGEMIMESLMNRDRSGRPIASGQSFTVNEFAEIMRDQLMMNQINGGLDGNGQGQQQGLSHQQQLMGMFQMHQQQQQLLQQQQQQQQLQQQQQGQQQQ
eukprot:CAMPEP_0197580392 /NCGR_PEP_ID=MMETSP1326-20131121/4200_1 /TAXON_ID=1155430 /ORGANISM="Genus nov. species nov., Strain RCC2288" /LENGTH=125 /DNA_ID=CAMNT_0043144127 /DNA_START=164 /DNA_END=538 /DNA_ORIENTATION=+